MRYRPNGLGFWSGHIPFACDLMATVRPETFVELGTQMGESYFAFCQAAVENGVHCQTFAVDTWRGDQHTRPYDDVVFEEVGAHNQAHYRGFSTLLRQTFDEAAGQFENESIDLLHIDGAHTYDAVSHDFLTWWPKVRAGGVVVLHDSFERQWEFGVWRLLDDLRAAGLPVGEFVHSHGLGVVVKPPVTGEENVAAALVTADETLTREMRAYYEACAGNLRATFLEGRRARPAEWELITHLFWRRHGEDFSEAHSVQLAHVLGPQQEARPLHIPASPEPYAGYRLILTLIPALFRLYTIRAKDSTGKVVWERVAERGLLFGGESGRAPMELELPDSLQAGGELELVMAGVNPLRLADELAGQPT
jgi:hypothetical protein